MEKFEMRIGDKPILVNVKNSVFTSNLNSSQKSNNIFFKIGALYSFLSS